MSKRRVFDIDFPQTDGSTPPPPSPAPSSARRGPMASAIAENAEALEARAATEQAIRVENDRLAHEHVRLKKAGLITDLVPVDKIRLDKLTRDRSTHADPDLEELKASIRAVGLSNPIQVEPMDDGNYELVQGYRRLSAYLALRNDSNGAAYAKIPATLVANGQKLDTLYRKMVDENLVRRDISFAEMAQLAIAYAQDPDTQHDDVDAAVTALYASAGRQKKNYIRRFASLLSAIGPALRFPEAIPRALGLDLEKRCGEEVGFVDHVLAGLAEADVATAEEEAGVLRALLAGKGADSASRKTPRTRAKTTLRCALPDGELKLTASHGKVEMQMDRDFTSVDRARLEAAVEAFVAALRDEPSPRGRG